MTRFGGHGAYDDLESFIPCRYFEYYHDLKEYSMRHRSFNHIKQVYRVSRTSIMHATFLFFCRRFKRCTYIYVFVI